MDDFLEHAENRINIPKLELHLNSPIRDSLKLLFIDALKLHPNREYNKNTSSDRIAYVRLPSAAYYPAHNLIQILSDKALLLSKLDNEIYEIFGTLLSYAYHPPPVSTQWVDQKSDLLQSILLNILKAHEPGLLKEFIDEREMTLTQMERRSYSVKVRLEDIRDRIITLAEKRNDYWLVYNTPFPVVKHAFIHKSFVIFVKGYQGNIEDGKLTTSLGTKILSQCEKMYLCTYEQFLCILDTHIARFFTLYHMRIMSDNFRYKVKPEDLIEIYETLDSGFSELGNTFYNQVKNFEPLVFSHILMKSDKLETRKDFNRNLMKDIEGEQLTRLMILNEKLKKFNTEQLCEIFGMNRQWGHPIVSEQAGCEKVKKIAHNAKIPDYCTLRRVKGALIREMCINFITVYSRWPACDISIITNPILKELVDKNERRLNLHDIKIPLEDWCQVKIQNELKIDTLSDYTEIISDTAISPILTENQYTYNSDCSGIPNIPYEKITTCRRLLTEITRRKSIDIREICEIIKSRCVPFWWYIVKLSPKERELKIEARLFAMMVMEMRLYFCMLEHNIVKNVFPLFPQQSMTLSEEKLMKRLIAMGKKSTYTHIIEMIMGIDFKSWNIHWNDMNTHIFAEMLDDWFGEDGLFTFGHEFFTSAEISLSSNFYIPEKYISDADHLRLDPNLYMWMNHTGGFEGIMQKFWTLITIGILLVVEEETGIASSIVGQGDNQVCKLRIPLKTVIENDYDATLTANTQHVTEHVNLFKDTLDKITGRIGLILKPEETWVSDSVLVYGKVFLINGAMASQSIKRVQRILTDVNDDYPTLNNRIGTLQSSGYSTAPRTHLMALPWFLSQLESGLALMRDIDKIKTFSSPRESNLLDFLKQEDFFFFFYLSSGEFTSVPMINPLEYYYRGHPDPFTTYITFLHKMLIDNKIEYNKIQNHPTIFMAASILFWLQNDPDIFGRESGELLISNPTSINFKIPTPLVSQFRRQIIDGLRKYSKNQDIQELFSEDSTGFDKEMYACLLSTEPLYPRLLSVIAQASPTGTRNYFMSKFNDSKTVKDLSLGGVQLGSSEMLTQHDRMILTHLRKLHRRLTQYKNALTAKEYEKICNSCPTRISHYIRVKSHAVSLEGKNIEGVTMPHPAHILAPIFSAEDSDSQYVSLFSSGTFSNEKMYTVGPQPAYVGSRTREKPSGKVITVSMKNRPLKDACRLRQMQTWVVEPNSHLDTFMTKLIQSRTNVSPELLSSISGSIFLGSLVHRVCDVVTKHDTLNNCLHTFTTHFALSSDKLALTARGGEDYNVQISGLFHYLLRLCLIRVMNTDSEGIRYVKGIRKNDCCHFAYANQTTIARKEGPTPPINTKNPLLYTEVTSFQEIVVPESGIITYLKNCSPSDAIGYYMMSRLRGITSVAIFSAQETTGPYASLVSMTEVLHVGIINIIKSFAKYLYIYIGESFDSVKMDIMSLGNDLWCGLGEICLMPSILSDLTTELSLDGIVDAYANKNQVIKRLNSLLLRELTIIHLSDSKRLIYGDIKFFLMNNVKYANILLMWNYRNLITEVYHYDLYEAIRREILTHIRKKFTWKRMMQVLIILFLDYSEETNLYLEILIRYPIRLVSYPPEYFFRKWEEVSTRRHPQTLVLDHVFRKCHDLLNTIYYPEDPIQILTHSLTQHTLDGLTFSSDATQDTYLIKKRLDQAYRLYNTLSTGYYKFLEIIVHEHINLNTSSICVADGEGSVSLMCALLSGHPTYYNSLFMGEVETQRYEHFVPGSFINHRDLIRGEKLSMIYGGNLTNKIYLDKFLSILPSRTSLLTCDAETSGNFDLKTKIGIYNALMKMLNHVHVENMIVKDFMDNTKLLAAFSSTLLYFFENVKIVIPHYSSRENLECFVVAIKKKNVNPLPLKENSLQPYADYNQWIEHIHNLKVKKQSNIYSYIATSPYKEQNLFYRFQQMSQLLHMHSNYEDSLSKLLDTAFITLKGTSLIHWLQSYKSTHMGYIHKQCMGYIRMSMPVEYNKLIRTDRSTTEGVPFRIRWMDNTSFSYRRNTVSAVLERCTDIQVNIELLLAILPHSVQGDAYASYVNSLGCDRHIIINGYEVYDYTLRDIRTYESKYLKHLWRVWGHNHIDI